MRYKLLLILLIMLPIVYGDSYTLHNVPKCVGEVQIKDTSLAQGYEILDCTKDIAMWTCPCKSKAFDIILDYTENQYTGYQFVIQYYIGDNSDENNIRTYSYEGMDLTPITPPPKTLFSFPDINIGTAQGIIAIIIIGVIFFIGLIFFLIKKLFKGKDTEIEASRDVVQDKEEIENEDDEDAKNILRKYT